MANEYEIFEFLEADNSEANKKRKRRRIELRQEHNPFDLGDEEFVERYRLSKKLTRDLCDELRPLFKSPKRTTDLSVETKVLIALSFYATGSYQGPIGSNNGHFVAQQTVSLVIAQVTACLNTLQMRQKHIRFPESEEERNKIKTQFYNKFGMPGVLGCIDCCHVPLVRPVQHEELYTCSKQYYSLNVQLVCDADMQVLSVDVSHGGAVHDAQIWASHPLREHLEELSNTEGTWFLGDFGYPLENTLMTPIEDAEPDSAESHYNNVHARARNVVKRTIDLLKARFRCLLVHRVLHYSPEVAGSIVTACVILHNICNSANIPMQELSDEDVDKEAQIQRHDDASEQPCDDDDALHQGMVTRDLLVKRLWEER